MPGGSPESEIIEDLIASAARGDRQAQSELLERYWPLIRDAVRAARQRMSGRLQAREDVDDLQQAAAIKILEALEDHEWRGRSAFAAWIRRLAQARVVDTHRHHAAAKRAAPEIGGSELDRLAAPARSAESLYDVDERFRGLMKELEALKPEYRTALVLHHLGYAHSQIAETLGCTPEAARKLVTRARRKLLELRNT